MILRFSPKRSLIVAGALVLSAAMAGAAAAAEPAKARGYKTSDLITQRDVERSPRGYRLSVPGTGAVYVKALRSAKAGKQCLVYKPALVKALAANPPTAGKVEWLELSIYFKPGGQWVCDLPTGGGCHVMVWMD